MVPHESKIHVGLTNYSINTSTDKGVFVFYPPGLNKNHTLPSMALLKQAREITCKPPSGTIAPYFYTDGPRNCAFIEIEEGTSLYGTGEVAGPLLRNGKIITLWNTGNLGYKKDGGRRLYQSHPWVLAVRSDGTAFGVIADTTWRLKIDLRNGIRFISDGPAFPIIVIQGESPQKIMNGLAELTGTTPMPPIWALGFHQCRWSYYPDSRAREIADEFRKRKIPCDAIWLDIDYMDGYRVFTFSPEYFPDPQATNRYLHDRGFKSVWMIDPGVKAERGYSVYDSGSKGDVWVKGTDGKEFKGMVWPGICVFPDFTRPETREWWAELYEDFMAQGIDGVWNDMNEPDVFDGPDQSMPLHNIHRGGGGLPRGSHAQYHNVYGMLMAKATREGIMKSCADKRPFLLTRSNFLGGHRYAATWTGDNEASWKHLRISIPMSLNLSLSGQPFNGADIGGFFGETNSELFAHWIAVGAFYPFARAHTYIGAKNKEPWAFGKKVEAVSKIALERRYRLLPYIYTLFREAALTGMPVMRPVFFADPKDADLRSEEGAFMLGGDLLVLPKWAKYPKLPKGIWRSISLVGEDSANDKYQPNLLMRGGSIVPLGRIIQNTTEKSLNPLTLLVCLDELGKAKGVLYEDAGDGYGYEHSQYLLTTYCAEKQGNKVIVKIADEEGNMKRPHRAANIEIITGRQAVRAKGAETGCIAVKI
jgi:alpha-glucosidase